jgi:hypothetical protein
MRDVPKDRTLPLDTGRAFEKTHVGMVLIKKK